LISKNDGVNIEKPKMHESTQPRKLFRVSYIKKV